MTNGPESISDLLYDNERLLQAMEQAVRETVREHKLLGQPIVVWRDGQVVWVPPEEIEVAPEEPPHSAANGVAPS